jgi:hypothetical protein
MLGQEEKQTITLQVKSEKAIKDSQVSSSLPTEEHSDQVDQAEDVESEIEQADAVLITPTPTPINDSKPELDDISAEEAETDPVENDEIVETLMVKEVDDHTKESMKRKLQDQVIAYYNLICDKLKENPLSIPVAATILLFTWLPITFTLVSLYSLASVFDFVTEQ